jgi:hypothetical protein
METIKLSIASDFTKTPGGRYKKQGAYSGEEFRDKYLEPQFEKAKKEGKKLIIDMDGCMGYPSSFIDESFGELGRRLRKKNIDFMKYVEIISNDQPGLTNDIVKYIKG